MEVINDIAKQYNGTFANNVIRQKKTHRINQPSIVEIVFLFESGVNIPNEIDGYKLKSQSHNYKYTKDKTLITVTAIYEDSKKTKDYIDFSNAKLKQDKSSNYFPYVNLGDGENPTNIKLPSDWKMYLNDEDYVPIQSILSELTNKGGYYIDYQSNSLVKFKDNSDKTEITEITENDIIDDISVNLKSNTQNEEDEIYVISKVEEKLQQPIFLENSNSIDEKTIIEGDENVDSPPEYITEIHDLSMNHDISGEKKIKKETTFIGNEPTKEKTVTYGFEYIADGNIQFISEKGRRININNFKQYWKKVEEVIKRYEYSKEGYLVRIITSGFKRGRFRIESDNIFETHKYGKYQFNFRNGQGFLEENKNYNPWKRSDFVFKRFPIEGVLEREYHPLAAYYDNVKGRQLNDIFIKHTFYNNENQEIETIYSKDKNWVEPFFLTSEYFYSACIGYSYNKYINKNGEYEIKKNDNITPSIFGEVKNYKKTFHFYSNKDTSGLSRFSSKSLNIEYLKKEENNYYTETKTIYQSGNEDFKEVAEKQEKTTNSGVPPIAERLIETEYEYDVANTSEPYVEIPDDYLDSSNTVITISSGKTEEMSKEKIKSIAQYIKPNDYDIAISKNLREATGNVVTKIKMQNSSLRLGEKVKLKYPGITKDLIVVSVSDVKDTNDKFSNGLFPNGSVRLSSYTEYELGIFENFYSEQKTTVDLTEDDETEIFVLPPLRGEPIGYTSEMTKSKITNIPNRGNAVKPLDVSQ